MSTRKSRSRGQSSWVPMHPKKYKGSINDAIEEAPVVVIDPEMDPLPKNHQKVANSDDKKPKDRDYVTNRKARR